MTDFFTDNFNFQSLFQAHLSIALTAWGIIRPDISEKLKHKQYDVLTADIHDLMANTAQKYGRDLVGFLTPGNRKLYFQPDYEKELWLTAGVKSSKENKLFLIGEVFVLIDQIWQQMTAPDQLKLPKDIRLLFMRTDTLRGITDDLSTVCINGKNAKTGGEKRSTRQARCKAIIQSPEYNIGARDAQKHLAETIQKIKDIYFEIYGESPQKPNKKGSITPCDKTITNWLYEFSKNNLPEKRVQRNELLQP